MRENFVPQVSQQRWFTSIAICCFRPEYCLYNILIIVFITYYICIHILQYKGISPAQNSRHWLCEQGFSWNSWLISPRHFKMVLVLLALAVMRNSSCLEQQVMFDYRQQRTKSGRNEAMAALWGWTRSALIDCLGLILARDHLFSSAIRGASSKSTWQPIMRVDKMEKKHVKISYFKNVAFLFRCHFKWENDAESLSSLTEADEVEVEG